jgi:outer membrane protein assembly factor BamB
MVIFGSYDSKLYAVYPNGTLAWDYIGCDGWIHTSPAYSILTQYIYFGSCDGQLRCLDAGDGKLIWAFETAYIPSSPALLDGRVYFGTYDMKLFCLDAENGDHVWNTTFEGDIQSSPAVNDEYVIVGCNDGYLYCLFRGNGTIRWKLELSSGPIETSPVIIREIGIVTYDQGLVVFDVASGNIQKSFLYGDAGMSSPSVSNGRILFGDRQGYVICIAQEQLFPPQNDDDDETWDLSKEVEARRDLIFFLISIVLIISVLTFIYVRKYRKIREDQ